MTTPYPSNSHKSREEPETPPVDKKVERVVTSPVTRRRKSPGKRLAEIFVVGDGQSVGAYILFDVVVPATKEMITDVFAQGIERMMFGESRSRRPSSGMPRNGRVSYDRYAKSPMAREEPRTLSRRARSVHDFQEVVLKTRVEAEEVIDRLFELTEKYNVATVADLYDLIGVTSTHADQNYGWDDLRGAKVTQVRGGYLLDMPQPEPVN